MLATPVFALLPRLRDSRRDIVYGPPCMYLCNSQRLRENGCSYRCETRNTSEMVFGYCR